MTVAAIIGLVAVLIFLIFSLTSVRVELVYEKNELNTVAQIYVRYLFIKKKIMPGFKKKNKKRKKDTKKQAGIEYYKNKITRILKIFEEIKEEFIDILKYCSKKLIVIEKLDFDFDFGLDEPMDTGIVNGLSYAAVYNILGVMHNYITIKKCNINISPDFERVCHRLKFNCILCLKNVHIIVIIVRTVKMYSKLKKNIKKGSN